MAGRSAGGRARTATGRSVAWLDAVGDALGGAQPTDGVAGAGLAASTATGSSAIEISPVAKAVAGAVAGAAVVRGELVVEPLRSPSAASRAAPRATTAFGSSRVTTF